MPLGGLVLVAVSTFAIISEVNRQIEAKYILPLQKLNARNLALEEEHNTLLEQRNTLTTQLQEFVAQNENLRATIEELRHTTERQEADSVNLREQLKETQERTTRFELAYRNCERDLEEALENLRELKEQNTADLEDAAAEVDRARDALKDLQATHEHMLQKYLALKEQMKADKVVDNPQNLPSPAPTTKTLRSLVQKHKPFVPPENWKEISTSDTELGITRHIEIHKAVLRAKREQDPSLGITEAAIMAESAYWHAKKAIPIAWLDEEIPEAAVEVIEAKGLLGYKGASDRSTIRTFRGRGGYRSMGSRKGKERAQAPMHINTETDHMDGACPYPKLSALIPSADGESSSMGIFMDWSDTVTTSYSSGSTKNPNKNPTTAPPVIVPPMPPVSLLEIQEAERRKAELKDTCTIEILDKVAKSAEQRKLNREMSTAQNTKEAAGPGEARTEH